VPARRTADLQAGIGRGIRPQLLCSVAYRPLRARRRNLAAEQGKGPAPAKEGSMTHEHFEHTRSAGQRLTYDVAIDGDRYVIRLGGKVLRDARVPNLAGNVFAVEVLQLRAICEIEDLRAMKEA
jgi:hypothetical protein